MIRLSVLSIVVALALSLALPLAECSTAGDSYQDLIKLIAGNEDDKMGVVDLAFLLVTHNFDAVPRDDYVEVTIDETVYMLKPNAAKPGLADILPSS